MTRSIRFRTLILMASTVLAILLGAPDARACWFRCRHSCYRPPACSSMTYVSVPRSDDADEAEFGRDLPKPEPPQDVPTVPSLEEMLQQVGRATGPGRAGLLVKLPSDATLFLENQPTHAQADPSRRIFMTPPMQEGWTYVYHARAEVVRDGKALTVTREVTVRAGEVSLVDFGNLAAEPEPPIAPARVMAASR